MREHGIVRPGDVYNISGEVDLELAAACTLLEKESYGGRNVWGHDPVKCGPKGGEVTEANYREYKKNRDRCGAQGCGPTQLTWPGFQDEADEQGGCWRWDVNTRYGFNLLAGYIRRYGMREAARRYNGSDSYADDFMEKLRVWRERLRN